MINPLTHCVALGFCASLQAVASFGTNPTSIQMNIYVPDKLATKPAIIVAVSKANQDTSRVFTISQFPANFDHSCTPVVEPVRSGMLVLAAIIRRHERLYSHLPQHPQLQPLLGCTERWEPDTRPRRRRTRNHQHGQLYAEQV